MKRMFFYCVLVLFCCGCATFKTYADLKYSVHSSVGSAKGVTVCVKKFEDARSHKQIGDNTVEAPILSKNDISEWVTSALREEMKTAGYKIDDRESQIIISGKILYLYCKQEYTFEPAIKLEVKVSRGEESIIEKEYSQAMSVKNPAQNISTDMVRMLIPGMSRQEKYLADALEQCLQQLMEQVIKDIKWELA